MSFSEQAAFESARRDMPNGSAARVLSGSRGRPQSTVLKDIAGSARPLCLPPPPGRAAPAPPRLEGRRGPHPPRERNNQQLL